MSSKLLAASALMVVCACAQTTIDENASAGSASAEFSVAPSDDLVLSVALARENVAEVSEVQAGQEFDIKFSISEMNGNGTMMSVENKLQRMVKYDLHMIDHQGNRHYTSSCPVIAGGSAFEHWPHKIPQIVVSNIRTLSDGSNMVCE